MSEQLLTRKQECFCLEFLVDHSKARAAIRAGYSEKSARKIGYELYQNPQVRARIDQLMKEREDATRVKAYRALEELAVVTFSDIDHYLVDDLGRVSLKEGAPEDAMRAIASVKYRIHTDRDGEVTRDVEIRLHEKNPALTNSLKHLGLLTEKIEITTGSFAERLRAARERVANGKQGEKC